MRTIISKMTHPYLMIHQCCKVKGSINNSIIWPLFKTFKANNSPRSFIKAFCNTLKVDIAESEGTRKIFTTLHLQNDMSVFQIFITVSKIQNYHCSKSLSLVLKCDQDILDACRQPNAK